MRPLQTLVALAALVAMLLPATAWANGDPASDVLLTDNLFLPAQPPSGDTVRRVREVIDRAREAGQPVRVAIIHTPRDLGSAANLFGHPREYAHLLGGELRDPAAHGGEGTQDALIVVMPAGYGTSNVPPGVDRELRSVELPAEAGPDELGAAAGYGVQELARGAGHPIEATFERPEAGGGGALTVVLVVVGLAALAGALVVVRLRTGTNQAEPGAPG